VLRVTLSLLAALLIAASPPPQHIKPPGPAPDPTLHVYRETTDGGIQQVLADDYVSHSGVVSIQTKLRKQASAYEHGNYPDPDGKTAAVGKLRAGASHIGVTYSNVKRGGMIRFKTSDPELVSALHDWMAATVRYNQKIHPDGGPGSGEPGN
jgi:hypothetical protein